LAALVLARALLRVNTARKKRLGTCIGYCCNLLAACCLPRVLLLLASTARKKAAFVLPWILSGVSAASSSWLPMRPTLVPVNQTPNTKNNTRVGSGRDVEVWGLSVGSLFINSTSMRPFLQTRHSPGFIFVGGLNVGLAVLLLLPAISRLTRLLPLLPTLPPPHNLAWKLRSARNKFSVGVGGQGDFSL
jgi:hypothetical protein